MAGLVVIETRDVSAEEGVVRQSKHIGGSINQSFIWGFPGYLGFGSIQWQSEGVKFAAGVIKVHVNAVWRQPDDRRIRVGRRGIPAHAARLEKSKARVCQVNYLGVQKLQRFRKGLATQKAQAHYGCYQGAQYFSLS